MFQNHLLALLCFGVCVTGLGQDQNDFGMPFAICVHAAEKAMKLSNDPKDQIKFLRGFRKGIELGVTNDPMASAYNKADNEDPFYQGIKEGLQSVTKGSDHFIRVSPYDLGYAQVSWRKGKFSHHHEGGLHFSFVDVDEDDDMLALFSSFAWNNWLTVRRKTTPDYSGEFWVRGSISPEGNYGHMGRTKRKIFITEVYQQTTKNER